MKPTRIVPISFKAGKVHFYSDFDGTYFHVREKELTTKTPINIDSYCKETAKFLDKTKGSIDFHITTGRHFDSYKKTMEFLKKQGIRLPMPDSLITENGKFEYKKTGNDNDFYETNKFPFDESKQLDSIVQREANSKKIGIKYGLDKLYDTKKSLLDSVKNKDIVIICGDGSNDFNMLNPLNYIDLDKYEKISDNKSFFQSRMHQKLKDLKAVLDGDNSEYINKLRNEFNNNGLLKELKELPLYCVIINRTDKEDLNIIEKTFSSLNKVLKMERGTWNKTVKTIIKKHAKENDEFKKAMSADFKNYIFGKMSIHNPYLSIPAATAAVIAFGCLIFKQTNKKTA